MPNKKKPYRIKNWRQYNNALMNRGNLFVWLSDDVVTGWTTSEYSGKPGASQEYSDLSILTCLTMRHVYSLTLRGTQGFMNSLLTLLKLDLTCPDYTTLSRRSKMLNVPLPCSKDISHVVVDSSGLKVYGEGEWKTRQYGSFKRRTWRKIHLCINPDNQEIIANVLTSNNVSDGETLPDLLNQIPNGFKVVSGDGAYDTTSCYKAIYHKGASSIIPPRKNGICQKKEKEDALLDRDKAIKRIELLGRNEKARNIWKQETGYHKRSLAETAMFRFKTIFGHTLAARSFHNQVTELSIKVMILNRMTKLSMPDSFQIG